MDDETIRQALPWIAALISVFGGLLCLLLYVGTERLLDRWTVYRLRVARRVRRADYIRWWRERA